MSDTTTQADVTYVPGAGYYAFRIDGLRLSEKEATDYLVERKGYRPRDAFPAVHLAEADAVNSAELPTICPYRNLDGLGPDQYEVDGARLSEKHLRDLLMAEYRRTPSEVEQILADAKYGR